MAIGDKQRITLTPAIYSVILEDMGNYMPRGTRNGFVNTLISCMIDRPEVNVVQSIHNKKEEYRQSLSRALALQHLSIRGDESELRTGSGSTNKNGSKTTDGPLGRLAETLAERDVVSEVQAFRNVWKASVRAHYADKVEFILLLTKEPYDIADLLDRARENWEQEDEGGKRYYNSRKEFLESMLYHYAIIPSNERERVFCSEFYNKLWDRIQVPLKKRRSYIITLYDKEMRTQGGRSAGRSNKPSNRFRVVPCRLELDASGVHYYMAGLAQREGEQGEPTYASYRLTRIESIERDPNPMRMEQEQLDELNARIDQYGIQFILSAKDRAPTCVRVRLTEKGWQQYWIVPRNRPRIKRDDNGKELIEETGDGSRIVTFECSAWQADIYFYPFAARAEVLEPADLHERMCERYREAAELYERTDGMKA